MKNLNLALIFYSILLASIYVNLSYACSGVATVADAGDGLISLVSDGYAAGVKKVLDSGKYDVNYIDSHGDTALSVAARRNDIAMMRLLLQYGANPDLGLGRDYLITHASLYDNAEMLTLLGAV